MSINRDTLGQYSLFEQMTWRTTVSIEPDHKLAVLSKSIPWQELMEKAVVILYDEQGISPNTGRPLNLRAHLGAYILQTVHGWTDRWTEEMLRFYIPARIFCGYLESEGSLDHTSIEEFRNRFGTKGAELITQDMMGVAKEFGFTVADDVDMDTTVQEAGITHPTEMKLMSQLFRKMQAINEQIKKTGRRGLSGIGKLAREFKRIADEYRLFGKEKTKEKKDEMTKAAKVLAEQALLTFSTILPGAKAFESLKGRTQRDILKLLHLGPQLMEQIGYWLSTGKVAKDKIVSLWKLIPTAIPKGKIGKPVEFGRKWLINCYRGGYLLVRATENPKMADAHCVLESLSLHSEVFDKMPTTYGADRAMWSQDNLELCLSAGIDKVALQPKGKAKALVNRRDLREFSRRRAAMEPRIGHLKMRGMGRSKMKTDSGDLISGYRSALSWNLSLLMRDLASKTMDVVPQC